MRGFLMLFQLGCPFSRCWCSAAPCAVASHLPVDILAVFILGICANAGFVKDFKG
jgi:hypothetical protein